MSPVRLVLETPPLEFLLFFSIMFPVLKRVREHTARQVSVIAGALSAVTLLVLTSVNIVRPHFLWPDEGNILGVSAVWVSGGTMYHAVDAPLLYSLLYGPSTFLVYAPLLHVFAGALWPLKTALAAAGAGTLVGLYLLARRWAARADAFGLLAVPVAILLTEASSLFGLRGDMWLLLCLVWATLAIAWGCGWGPALTAGGLCGVALNFKFTVSFVILGLLLMLGQRSGWRKAIGGAVACAFVAAAPFFLPRVSFWNYAMWLLESGRQGWSVYLLVVNAAYACLYLAPGLLLRWSSGWGSERWSWTLAGVFGTAGLVAVITGSKNGAGSWHLWPLLPACMLWMGWEARSAAPRLRPGVTAAVALAAALLCLRYAYRDWPIAHWPEAWRQTSADQAAQSELQQIERRFPGGKLAMGYGSEASDLRTDLSYLLPLEHEEYVVDANAVAEELKAKTPFPDKMQKRMLGCDDRWLIPHAEKPFWTTPIQGVREMQPWVFPEALRTGFPLGKQLLWQGKIFDVWGCP